ncbi:MAG: hypothetical protein ACTHN5_14950 [Phycisphaerae bacterium]
MDVKIEALLREYVLGGVNEEVGVLVEAYVERDEGVRRRLEELRGTVRMAKGVLRSDIPPAKHAQGPFPEHGTRLPAYPGAAIGRAVWRRRALLAGAMAACVAVGVWAGWFWTVGRSGQEVVVRVEREQTTDVVPVGASAGGVRDFWSVERLRAAAQEARSDSQSDARSEGAEWRSVLNSRHSFGGGL